MKPPHQNRTSYKAMLMLLYHTLQGKTLIIDEFIEIVKKEGIISTRTALHRFQGMQNSGLVSIYKENYIRLTERGLFLLETKERILENTLFGQLLTGGMNIADARDKFLGRVTRICGTYSELTNDRFESAIRSLKKRALVDYTTERIWRTRDIKEIKR